MKLWVLLLGIFLVLFGLSDLIDLSFKYERQVRGALALAAGVFLFIQK